MKIKISKAILVEGKYDKIKLESFIDGLIIPTNGFRIFKDKQKRNLIKTLCNTVGIIIVTDSDVAGFKIRNYIKSITKNSNNITNIYIPQIKGKEKRKSHSSKEGTLGVEGLDVDLLKQLFKNQNVDVSISGDVDRKITKFDLFENGFCGKNNSFALRTLLLKQLSLPSYLSTNSLLDIINTLISYEDFVKISENIHRDFS